MQSESAIQILLVEDDQVDAQLLLHELKQSGFVVQCTRVETEAAFVAGLRPELHAILYDYRMPSFDPLRALQLVQERCPEVPFIIVSGSIGDEQAAAAIRHGATDYLLKDRLGRIGVALRQAFAQRQLKQSQLRAQEALRASEAQYRALAESIPQLVWMSRPDAHVEYVNLRVLAYSGRTMEQCLGQATFDLIHPDDLERMAEPWRQSLARGEPGEFEYRIRRADGQYRWHIMRSVAMRDGDGRIVKWLGTCTDIHDQKEAAALLARDAQLLAGVRDSIIVTDLAGIVTYWNKGATELFGWTAEEMIGRAYADRFPASMREQMVCELRERAAGSEWNGEFCDVRKDGSRVWIHSRVNRLNNASGEPAGVLGVAYDITARLQAEQALRLRDRAMQAISQGLLITDANQPDNPIIYASPAFERLTGYSSAEILGRNCRFLQGKDTDPASVAAVGAAIRNGSACQVELVNYRKDGTPFWNALTIAPVRDGDRVTHFIGVQTDVSERRRSEMRYRQGQKMEAFGQLAGGVAHDFNNLLTIINTGADLVLADLSQQDPQWELLSSIRDAGQRAAGLTSQLLTFSRKTIVEPKILDLNDVVEQLGKMLRRLLGEDISLVMVLDPRLRPVKVDPSQIDQVIMNLSINARDAMPTGGRLTVETKNVELRTADCPADSDYRPGHYVSLRVSDTGCGMTAAVQAKLFEPFFTTKAVGKGSGLGLATVYGIAKTYRGHVEVWSEVNRGTAVTVLLPATTGKRPEHDGSVAVQPVKGYETLLVVEDEPMVRRLLRVALEAQGYKVLEARDGEDAIRLADSHAGPIHLLLTDVVMPGLGGREVARQVLLRRSTARVLYISGYTDDAIVRHGVIEATDAFLQKPFTPSSLSRKVRELLDSHN